MTDQRLTVLTAIIAAVALLGAIGAGGVVTMLMLTALLQGGP